MYFAKKNLLLIQFFHYTTPFYNFKTKIDKPNEKVNQSECKQCFHSPFLEFRSSWKKNSQDDIKDPKVIKLQVP